MSLSKGCKLHCWAVPAWPHGSTPDTFWVLVGREAPGACEKHNETFIYSFQQLPDPSCSAESDGSTCYRLLLTHKVFPPLKGTAGCCWVRRSCTVPWGEGCHGKGSVCFHFSQSKQQPQLLPGTIQPCHPGRPCAVGTGGGTQERTQGTLRAGGDSAHPTTSPVLAQGQLCPLSVNAKLPPCPILCWCPWEAQPQAGKVRAEKNQK